MHDYRIQFIESLAKSPSQDTNISKKSKKRRLKLALKIFDHIRFKNNESLKNSENFANTDDTVIFSQFEKLTEPKSDSPNPFSSKCDEFDHLKLFRPYLQVIDGFKSENCELISSSTSMQLKKVSKNEFENWMERIVWNASDIKGDYRNDLHTIKAGWIPASNQRTWAQFLSNGIHQQEISSFSAINYRCMANSLCLLNANDVEHLNVDPKSWFSLFPTDYATQDYIKGTIIDFESLFLNKSDFTYFDKMTTLDIHIEKDIEKNERTMIRNNISKSNNYDIKNDTLIFNNICKTFYISSDEFYWPPKRGELIEDEILKIQIKHSLPALDLQRTFFPTYMDVLHLRRWHRPLLSDYHHGNKMKVGTHVVQNLKRYNEESLKIYQEIIEATKSDDVFLMKSLKDISSLNGHLILLEYSEEYPILLNQIGMNSLIRVYCIKGENKDNPLYGDLVEILPNMSPFLGNLIPNKPLTAIENNMFRAPLYSHKPRITDFLIIKNSHGYFIRNIPIIFIVGQEHPKMEVPSPNSKAAIQISRERVQMYILTLFMKCKDNPKKIKIANVRRAFKQHSENNIRKRLKMFSNYIRIKSANGKLNWWVLKNDFRLPTYEDLHEKLQPETICTYYSMLAAQRRLKDAGYGKKSLFMAEDENEEDTGCNKIIDEEILCAPWHTTRAFVLSQKGKCLISVSGFADPTGCGEGFSFVRINYKSQREESSRHHQNDLQKRQKMAYNVDSDLRKLRMSNCRQILLELGISSERIDRMARWDMINFIRNISLSSKSTQVQDVIEKYTKNLRNTGIETMEKYREICQSIFDRENQILSSTQEYSSDEENEEISDLEELNKDLETMLHAKEDKITKKYIDEEEEISRLDLIRLLKENKPLIDLEDEHHIEEADSLINNSARIARILINRTFIEDGKEFVRTEVVTDPRIIFAYLRITRNKNYRQVYAKHDIKTIEELRKEKKRVQDQLRRIKRNEEKESNLPKVEAETLKEKPPIKTHVKCTVCHGIGHMRTNKICPRYMENRQINMDKSSDTSDFSDEKPMEAEVEVSQNSIKVEGTRLVFNRGLVDAADEQIKKSLMLKIPKDLIKRKKRIEDYNYYGNKIVRNPSSRRKSDPKIYINAIFEDIITSLRNSLDSWPFQQPVCPKKVPDYYLIVKKPVNLLTLRDSAKSLQYDHRDQFIEDLKMIESNSILYNGLNHPITTAAKAIVELGIDIMRKRNQEISMIEVEINPLLSNDPQQKISWIFESIVSSARSLPAAHPFLCPVNTKLVRDYSLYIQKPIDLETIKMNVINNIYPTRETFLVDVELILSNCIQYNGVNHAYTKMAHEVHDYIVTRLQKDSELLSQLEENIRKSIRFPYQNENSAKINEAKSFMKDGGEGSYGAKLLEDLEMSNDSDKFNDL